MSVKLDPRKHKYVTRSEVISEYLSLEGFIAELNRIKALIPLDAVEPCSSVTCEYRRGYYDDIETDIRVNYSYWVEFTPEELQEREDAAKEKRAKAIRDAITRKRNKEEKDREEYERLKKKFEGK